MIEVEVRYELKGLAAVWRNEVFVFGSNSVQTGKPHVQKQGRVWSVPDGAGKLLFLEALGKTLFFLSVYKIIVCKIKRHAIFSVFGADHSTCESDTVWNRILKTVSSYGLATIHCPGILDGYLLM